MRRNRVTEKDILFLSISMFVMVCLWTGFNLFHAWVTSKISVDLQAQIAPIDPNFDTDTLHTLKTRDTIVPLFESSPRITPVEPEASQSAIIAPSPEPSLSPSPSASVSGEKTSSINPTTQPITPL